MPDADQCRAVKALAKQPCDRAKPPPPNSVAEVPHRGTASRLDQQGGARAIASSCLLASDSACAHAVRSRRGSKWDNPTEADAARASLADSTPSEAGNHSASARCPIGM